MHTDHSPQPLWEVAAGEATPMGFGLRRLAGAQLRKAAAESALSPGELVESRTSGPPYSALKPTSEHSVVAVVVVVAAVELSVAVARYLLQQHFGAQTSRPGPAGRGAGGQRVCHVYSRAAAPAWRWQVAGAAGNIPPQMED